MIRPWIIALGFTLTSAALVETRAAAADAPVEEVVRMITIDAGLNPDQAVLF